MADRRLSLYTHFSSSVSFPLQDTLFNSVGRSLSPNTPLLIGMAPVDEINSLFKIYSIAVKHYKRLISDSQSRHCNLHTYHAVKILVAYRQSMLQCNSKSHHRLYHTDDQDRSPLDQNAHCHCTGVRQCSV